MKKMKNTTKYSNKQKERSNKIVERVTGFLYAEKKAQCRFPDAG